MTDRVNALVALDGAARHYRLAGRTRDADQVLRARDEIAELVRAARAACRTGTLPASTRKRLNLAIRGASGRGAAGAAAKTP